MLARKEMRPPSSEESQVVTIPPNPLPRLDLVWEEDDEPTLKMARPVFEEYRTGPNWGAIACLFFLLGFWSLLIWAVFIRRG